MKPLKKFAGIAFVSSVLTALVATISFAPQASQAGSSSARSCINSNGMSTQILDESSILATNGSHNTLIKVTGCRLDSSKVLVFEYRGSTQICEPLDVDLKLMTSTGTGLGFPEPCFISEVTSLSKEEAKNLRSTAKK